MPTRTATVAYPLQRPAVLLPTGAIVLGGCDGHLSTLSRAGTGASDTLDLFLVMSGVALLVWLFVMAAAVVAARRTPDSGSVRSGHRLMVFGGILLPLVLLGSLSWFGFRQSNALLEPGDGLVVHVTGERWWWRVRYEMPDGRDVVSANEIRLPLGERVEFRLDSSDVIHSFWIPSLGGKIDMMPGRPNRLVLEASREGRFRGACAEFCGLSHTLMEFDVVVMAAPQFGAWLEGQARGAREPQDPLARQGRRLFLEMGCGACHRIAGTEADGLVGPDLTHLGSRLSIAAGTLPADAGSIAAWIAHSDRLKPGVLMPPYPMLNADELAAIGRYLEGLE